MSAQAEKTSGVVRVLLTRLKVTDQVEISLDGSYTLNDIAFQRGSHLTVACLKNELYVYYEGMSVKLGKQLTLVRHEAEDGLENGVRFNGAYELHPGDSIFVYTDGVPEAANGKDELFGTDRMLEALNKDPNATLRATLKNVADSIEDFADGADQFDDITMLGFTYNGPRE